MAMGSYPSEASLGVPGRQGWPNHPTPFPSRSRAPTHLDFVGGQGKAFAACRGPQGDGVELALVEVGHGRLARLDVNGFGGAQGVLEVAVGRRERTVRLDTQAKVSQKAVGQEA